MAPAAKEIVAISRPIIPAIAHETRPAKTAFSTHKDIDSTPIEVADEAIDAEIAPEEHPSMDVSGETLTTITTIYKGKNRAETGLYKGKNDSTEDEITTITTNDTGSNFLKLVADAEKTPHIHMVADRTRADEIEEHIAKIDPAVRDYITSELRGRFVAVRGA